jgi:hypothetical protein
LKNPSLLHPAKLYAYSLRISMGTEFENRESGAVTRTTINPGASALRVGSRISIPAGEARLRISACLAFSPNRKHTDLRRERLAGQQEGKLVEIFANANIVRRYTIAVLIGLPARLRNWPKTTWKCRHVSNFGQQSDHRRCIAEIGKENVGRILPQMVYGVLT